MTISKTIANLLPLPPPKKKNLPVSESRDLPAAVHNTKQCIVIQCVTIELVKGQTRRTQKEKKEGVIFLVNLQGLLVYVSPPLPLLFFQYPSCDGQRNKLLMFGLYKYPQAMEKYRKARRNLYWLESGSASFSN